MYWYFIRSLFVAYLQLVPSFKVFKMWTGQRSACSWSDLIGRGFFSCGQTHQPQHPKVKASGHKLVHRATCWWEAPPAPQHHRLPSSLKHNTKLYIFLKNTLSSVSFNSGHSIN